MYWLSMCVAKYEEYKKTRRKQFLENERNTSLQILMWKTMDIFHFCNLDSATQWRKLEICKYEKRMVKMIFIAKMMPPLFFYYSK